MKLCFQLVLLLTAAIFSGSLQAQTLNESLIAEDLGKLAETARGKGDVVRGAILFHQGNINCAKCHRPKSETDRIGPDLSRLDREITDAMIVESVLQPSKAISKGFETVKAIMTNGQFFEGTIILEDPEKIILRDISNTDRQIRLDRNELEEVRPGTKSSMPDGLVNELKNRQQFLDLIRYVLEVRDRGPTTDVSTTDLATRLTLTPELEGLLLINELNCVACHQSRELGAGITAKQAPKLTWSAKWLNPQYLASFIADPHAVKHGSTMPQLLGHLDPETRQTSARAIAQYLASIAKNGFEPQPINTEAAARGEGLFDSIGCVACHWPRDKSAIETGLEDSVPLGELAGKYNIDGLVDFLENPLGVRPSGRMPKMQLTRWEATDIANYLLQRRLDADESWSIELALIKQGEKLFTELRCNSCHSGVLIGEPQLANQVSLGQLRSNQGCLSNEQGQWPNFQLDEQQKQLIQAALQTIPAKLNDEQQIEFSLRSFNCIACHNRNDFGGVTALRNPHFQTTNMNLGEQGRIPPTLTGVGAKLNPKWMRDVLVNGRVIRPYMKTRMPQFGEENVGHLVDLFQRTDKLGETKFATFDDQKEMRKLGLELAGNEGLNCVACHTFKYELSDTMPAVDLTEMAERLKKDWFHQYMLNPQKFSPNTVMPSFWPGGVAIRKDLAGDPAFQVEALWQYLIDGRQAGAPRGVVREPLEIVVTDEVQMLRRSYPGIGKRGIGVGYPGGLNLAFDAEQLRLAMIWKGKFVDPAGVWSGQGSGNVRPLGKPIDFGKGPELDDRDQPWIVDQGRPPNHHFKGYSLDEFRRPTFVYQFENVAVQDYFQPIIDQGAAPPYLRRTVSLAAANGREQLGFRAASAEQITDEGNGLFSVGKGLKIKLLSGQNTQIVRGSDGQQLQILVDVVPARKQQLVIEYSWEQ